MQVLLTDGKRYVDITRTTTDFSNYFDNYVFEGGVAARDAAFACLQ